MSNKVLVTGAAGFIGFHLIDYLNSISGYEVIGIDNFNGSSGAELPLKRAKYLEKKWDTRIINLDLSESIAKLPQNLIECIDVVVHLAAWPGVSGGQIMPIKYYKNNVTAFGNILDLVNTISPKKFFFASSSSVYGDSNVQGGSKEFTANGKNLKSFYASTKWANEIMAESFSKIHELSTIALRFFTVFGSFGRPDMAYWKFTEKLIRNEQIVFWGKNGGTRNFTHVSDATKIIEKLIQTNLAGYNSLNIAAGQPVSTKEFCDSLARSLKINKYSQIEVARPWFDVESTWANTELLNSKIGPVEAKSLDIGTKDFTDWYLESK